MPQRFRPPNGLAETTRRLSRRAGAVTAALVAGCVVLAGAVPATATATQRAPIGHLDSVVVTPGGITVTGWAADPDAPTTSILVKVTLGPATRTTTGYSIVHNSRPDVGRAYPALGPHHGFNYYQTAPTGRYPVCVAAVDLSGATTPLGCSTVTVPADRLAIGHLDSARSIGNNHVTVAGWAADLDTPSAAVRVNVLLGGRYIPTAYNDVNLLAETARPDVAVVYPPLGPAHGFSLTIAARTGTYPVCAYTFDNFLLSAPTFIGCVTVTV